MIDVLVAGGGVGGLAAALSLAREGVAVRVLERSGAFGEVGAGMQIAPNCTRILDDLGLRDEAAALGVAPESMVMRDAVDGGVLTSLDLRDLERRYGHPYLVIHRSDLHGILLRACERAGVELATGRQAVGYENVPGGARVRCADGHIEEAALVVAADGLHSLARKLIVDDEPVSSAYVAYRGAMPIEMVRGNDIADTDVVVYVGPGCHFVQYPLRGGEMFNQVAVFESPTARAGQEDWGTPDELDAAFAGTCEQVQQGLPLMWRDRWWRMYDRDPIMSWVTGRIVLLGDAAHPPLQYMAQGAVMAIEDGWVLARHIAEQRGDWDAALAAYDAVRPEHCRRVVETARVWGELWHLSGLRRLQRNAFLTARDVHDYRHVDWIYGPTALHPDQEPPLYPVTRLADVPVPTDEVHAV